jgi:adenosyl cobinamide kinase/adenosyl cobinamide phosphate guanylyltransferase
MVPSNEEVIHFLQQRIKHLKELRTEHNTPDINDYIDDKLEMFMQEYNSLMGACVHTWVVTQVDKDGDWMEAECVDCCLLKTNS